MIKQYTITPDYADMLKINLYHNGELITSESLKFWRVFNHTSQLEKDGYKRAYDLIAAKEALEDAQEMLEYAQEEYQFAINNPLMTV